MRNKINYSSWYIIAFSLSVILMSLYKYPEELDIIRTFERAENDAQVYSSLITYISDIFHSRLDFVYFCFLHICVKIGAPLGVATTFVLFAYFALLIKISTLCLIGRGDNLLLFSVLVAVPTVTVISVSRNTFADVFLLFGFYYYLKGEKRQTLFFLLVAVLSHFSVLMYVGIFVVAIFLSKREISNKFRVGLLLGIVIVGFTIPTFLNNTLLQLGTSFLGGTHYHSYESLNDSSVLRASQISNGDKLYFAYTLAMLIFLSLKDKKRDAMNWFMFMMCFLDAFFFNSSVQMSLRLTILTPFCIGYSLMSLHEQKILSRQNIQIIAYSMLFITIVYYYSVRPVFINL